MTPEIDAERLAIYRANLQPLTCVICFLRDDEREEYLVPTRLIAPAEFPRDLATFVHGYTREDGSARLCRACDAFLQRLTNPNDLVDYVTDRHLSSPWFQRMTDEERMVVIGAFYIVSYVWWRTNRLPDATPATAPPALRFAVEVMREFPMLPPPRDALLGAAQIFTRDVSLGCYLTFYPSGMEVIFSDFGSRRKGQGNGGIVFRKLLAIADRCSAPIVGAVEAHANAYGRKNALSNAQLLRWYQKLGFEVQFEQAGHAFIRRSPRP